RNRHGAESRNAQAYVVRRGRPNGGRSTSGLLAGKRLHSSPRHVRVAYEIWEGFMRQHHRDALLAILMLGLAGPAANAEDAYPSKPVRIVVSFAAGGPTDIVARVMGARMGELMGQQFTIENRVGAGGNIGADVVAKAPSDGYTLLMATVSTHAINPGL